MPNEAKPDVAKVSALGAADAAVAEADAKPNDTISLTHAGVEISFRRKRLDSVQFRRIMQQRLDVAGLEYLLGPRKVDELLAALADEDGDTSEKAWNGVFTAIGEQVGVGNS